MMVVSASVSSSSVTCESRERRAGDTPLSTSADWRVSRVHSCLPCVEEVWNVFFCFGSDFEREPGTLCLKVRSCCPSLRSSCPKLVLCCPNLGQSGNLLSQIGTERGSSEYCLLRSHRAALLSVTTMTALLVSCPSS